MKFNLECTPSPAKYNVAGKSKIKYGVIPQSDRFLPKLESPITSDAESVHSTPCFQTVSFIIF